MPRRSPSVTPDLTLGYIELLVLAGGLLGGFVNGLSGFGTGLAALSIWLIVLAPTVAAPLVIILSIIGQLQSLPQLHKHINWKRAWPFIAGGLAGVPVGALILPLVLERTFKLGVGIFLIVYCAIMLMNQRNIAIVWGGRTMDGVIGLFGGILGGISGLSGPIPTIWIGLRGWSKDERRGVFLGFSLTILTTSLVAQWIGGFVTWQVGKMVLVALPGTLFGVWCGLKIYSRLGHGLFDKAVLAILMLAGLSTVVAALD